jgi:membrane protease YdiL (CAAX protease family)
MKPLRVHQRLLIFVTAALAIACLISPWMALGADWFSATWPHLLPERVPFSKVFNRAFMIAGIVSFIIYRRWLLPPDLHPLLFPGYRVAVRNFLTGWGLAVLSMVLLATAMVATDVFDAYFRLSLATSLSRIAGALAAGTTVGFFEELFFRGILFLGLSEHGRRIRAYLFTNLFYAALHFVKPGENYFMDELDLLAGFRHLLTTFEPFLEPLAIAPGLIGLFLTGVVLSYALERTRNLYLSIGLHAGWIFCLKSFRVFGNFSRGDLGWAFGSTDPKIVSGVMTWLGILLVALAIALLTRRTALLSAGLPSRKSI